VRLLLPSLSDDDPHAVQFGILIIAFGGVAFMWQMLRGR
jgi:hypothetical protein